MITVCRRNSLRPAISIGFAFFIALGSFFPFDVAVGQQVAPTSYEGDKQSNRLSAQGVTFRRRSPEVGDQVKQSLQVTTHLKSLVRQAQQVVEQGEASVIQTQERIVVTSDVYSSRSVAAHVKYLVAQRESSNGASESVLEEEPVVGKTYRCRREGEKLLVTDDQGNMPPMEEFSLVIRGMESLGKPNPLAQLLGGKSLAPGQTVSMPLELAKELLGFEGAIDTLDRFDLNLLETRQVHGITSAVFETILDVSNHTSNQMRMHLSGKLTVELDGCRLVDADLRGPLGMAQSVQAAGGAYHMTATGEMHVQIQSQYRDVNSR